jgi:hypothetical protein
LLLLVPGLLLVIAAAPTRVVPARFAVAWVDHRAELGMLGGSLLLLDALFYMLFG